MKYVSFQTELFFTDMPDEQLDCWFLGGDCSGWFYARLLPVNEIKHQLDPVMEDWGWIMAVEVAEIVVDIYVWEYLDMEKRWVLGVAAKKKWLRKTAPEAMKASEQLVVMALNDILESDDRFSQIRWTTENPMENVP